MLVRTVRVQAGKEVSHAQAPAARPALGATEARQVRKLAQSVHAPADWIFHAKLVVRSWDGPRTRQIAEELGCNR